ncbi:MAG: TetR/AcrR family transcriptional regulator [OM182 bacterium]|nr:TetR/AcrR family transcriptional regulator [OM182 bacterium]
MNSLSAQAETRSIEVPCWPQALTMEAFRAAWPFEGEAFWQTVFEMHSDKMQIKNPRVAIVNLEKIFTATFALTTEKGFQAMSLRDLSSEAQISMGGLYSYIGSKEDLASVIEGVLRACIDKVVAGLNSANLEPVDFLRTLIFSEIYMVELLRPWYQFCFMEVKGLPREQQQQTLELELRFEESLVEVFEKGKASGVFQCKTPKLLASQVTAQLEQWHLKQWKFKLRGVSNDDYAQFIFDNLMRCLHCASA